MGLPTAFLSRGRPLKGPFYLRLSFLATRKRVHELLKAQLIGNLVLLQLIFNVLLDFLFVLSYRIHEVSPGPEMPISIVVLGTPKEWNVSRRNFTPTSFFSFLWAAAALW